MAKRNYALVAGAGIFYDERTKLKVLPGAQVAIDKDDCGTRTMVAIQHGHLLEVSDKPAAKAQTEKAKTGAK